MNNRSVEWKERKMVFDREFYKERKVFVTGHTGFKGHGCAKCSSQWVPK